jgi:ribonuclease BN (tRNA processing enzyme)
MIRTTVFTFLAWLFSASCAWPGEATGVEAQCPPVTGVALQVLGSGGPIADDGRSSSSYIVWIDGKNRIMVDAGSGSFLRFGEAGARFEDLELIALSHYHTDHAAGLPALLKTGYFSTREIPLRISGPASRSVISPGTWMDPAAW